jgi:hypothetical protein
MGEGQGTARAQHGDMASKRSASKKAPWDRPSPVTKGKQPAKHLSPAQKKHAAARAKKAGRPYPNLVDNMAETSTKSGASKKATKRKSAAPKAAAKTSVRKTSAKKSPRKTSAKKSPRKAATKKGAARAPSKKARPAASSTKDPRGGLTAAGRKAFAKRDGSHLKPGVKKRVSEMSPAEMRRKGSWAARFYGRSALPALVDEQGKPTRFALTAAAWGEPVPKTESAARRIAAKGRALLERARAAVETRGASAR